MEEGAEKLKYTNNLKDKKVTFKSSNPEIATVSEEGMVKAISRGKATITIVSADGQYSDNCEVIVKNIVDYLEASCLGCNGVVINGLIQSGSKLNWSLINKSNVDIVLKSLQLVDGVTGSAGNEMDVEDSLLLDLQELYLYCDDR